MEPSPDHSGPLKDDLLRAIAARGGVRRYPAQTVLVHEDDRSDSLYIIVEGRVKIYGSSPNGREIVYNTHGPGEYFGEMTLDGGPRSVTLFADDEVELWRLPFAAFERMAACALAANVVAAPRPTEVAGIQLVSQGNVELAEHCLRRALEADPKHKAAVDKLRGDPPQPAACRQAAAERQFALPPLHAPAHRSAPCPVP